MEINWKVVGVFGGIGFFLSLLVGAISGVTFGTVLLRAVVSGVVFGGIGFGMNFLIKKYLPGLVSEGAEGEAFTEDESGGVNIVIEEEAPPVEAEAVDIEGDESDEDREPQATFVEEVEERTGDDVERDEAPEEAEAVEELEEAEEEEAEPVTLGEGSDVDSLPDIGEFSGNFETDGEYEDDDTKGEQASAVDSGGGSSSPIEILGQEESPANVAKAVQTMLKRE